MLVLRSLVLFVFSAAFEIVGAWLIWQGTREHRGWIFIGAGIAALGVYGFVATLQPDANFGRVPWRVRRRIADLGAWSPTAIARTDSTSSVR